MTSNVGPEQEAGPPSSPALGQPAVTASRPVALAPAYPPAVLVEDEPLLDDRPHATYGNGAAASPLPHMAMPQLMGAPAYARPPRTVTVDTPRPFDPDDLPLEAFRTQEEHQLAMAYGVGAFSANGSGGVDPAGHAGGDRSGGGASGGAGGGLRGFAARLLGTRD